MLNSNIRCIEIYKFKANSEYESELNSNIRCIEIARKKLYRIYDSYVE